MGSSIGELIHVRSALFWVDAHRGRMWIEEMEMGSSRARGAR